MAIFSDGRASVHFGDNRYQQYRDSTSLKLYKHLDHNDEKRKKAYYDRHGKAICIQQNGFRISIYGRIPFQI
jgi:hypothetical protein